MKSLVDSGNFKHPDHKLKTMGANMSLSKAVLLMSARLPRGTVHALKTSSGRLCARGPNWASEALPKKGYVTEPEGAVFILPTFPRQNLPPGSVSPFLSPVPSCNPILAPALVPALAPASVPALIPASVATNKLFKQFMKAYLEMNQGSR